MVDQPAADQSRIEQGWGWPGASKKAHFFLGSMRSMCGKWAYTGKLENYSHDSRDNCAECKRRRLAHFKTDDDSPAEGS